MKPREEDEKNKQEQPLAGWNAQTFPPTPPVPPPHPYMHPGMMYNYPPPGVPPMMVPPMPPHMVMPPTASFATVAAGGQPSANTHVTNKPLPPWHQMGQAKKPNPPSTINIAKPTIKMTLNDYSKQKKLGVSPIKVDPVPAPPPPAPKVPSAQDWPVSLKAYVQRCFQACKNDREKDQIEAALKEKVQTAIEASILYSIDWDQEPLVTVTGKAASALWPKSFAAVEDEGLRKKQERAARFRNVEPVKKKKPVIAQTFDQSVEVMDWDEHTIVGTMTQLEKPYLRLTSAPDPSTVRPLPVLRKALEWLKGSWKSGRKDYPYLCDQLKSLRQDLTVQRITNDFTVEAYEVHARMALEAKDFGEYNQCQTQLRRLYATGMAGCQEEFIAYRVLYLLGTKNPLEINRLMAELTPEQHANPVISHALEVRQALALHNYHALLVQLRPACPNLGGHLMDVFLPRERTAALLTICKAYRPSVRLAWLCESIGLESMEVARAFLDGHNVVWVDPEAIDTKASLARLMG